MKNRCGQPLIKLNAPFLQRAANMNKSIVWQGVRKFAPGVYAQTHPRILEVLTARETFTLGFQWKRS